MSQIIGEFRIGEDVVIGFAPATTPAASITIVAAGMSPATPAGGGDFVIQDNSSAIALTVATLPAQGSIPAGWTFTLPAAQSALLTPGVYAIDAKFTVAGSTEKTAVSAFVKLTRAAVA